MKPTKNQIRRARKKALKKEAATAPSDDVQQIESKAPSPPPITQDTLEDSDSLMADNPLWDMYQGIVARFENTAAEHGSAKEAEKPQVFFDDADDIPDEDEEAEPRMSKKKRKEMTQLSVAELKAVAPKPDIVEWTDTSASDPRLLIHIKAHRNVVPVPQHWSLKREYLSSKRGVEKAPFALPKFIQETGISAMRDAALEKQEASSLKQKQRERVQPKMGKLDIDYQKLYEAFFRFQTKPELTRYGEIYFEGKEYETNLKHLRPGELSAELMEALGMSPSSPPPWLINQQRFGIPPSYPALKIPGINAPLPEGAIWGYAPGAYGKPPVDEHNRPLYGGDIFGMKEGRGTIPQGEPVERDLWGELQPDEESEEESEEDDDEEDEDEEEQEEEAKEERGDRFGLELPAEAVRAEDISGDYNVSGKNSKSSVFENRSGPIEVEDSHGRTAHQIIPEKHTSIQGFFGGDRVYDLSTASARNVPVLGAEDESRKRKKPGDVDVSVDLDANDLSKDNLQNMYDTQRQQENNPEWGGFQEDLSDMIAQESRKRARKAEERRGKR
ncbi:hypothetical protein N7495_000668 [Penicillium taxi]|uniref:uncharacterized protein n=1 Tax=Penicillium taxi TaxID=168475 RepID=UPI002544F578|nr:uncharacterized protein N7495_000668 [Penicillium taxi]KAJ5907986.1 hypothetical protein N7495_000668 [Penicillium taxi]